MLADKVNMIAKILASWASINGFEILTLSVCHGVGSGSQGALKEPLTTICLQFFRY